MEKPFVQLTGEDGNVFSVIARVSKALTRAGQPEQAQSFKARAFSADSYEEVLQLAMDVCEVA